MEVIIAIVACCILFLCYGFLIFMIIRNDRKHKRKLEEIQNKWAQVRAQIDKDTPWWQLKQFGGWK